MKTSVDNLVQRSDSETGVKQTLNNLVNRAIVTSELTALQKKKLNGEHPILELPRYEWDRLRAWLKMESLSNDEFADTLAILNAQAEDRKKADANSFLSEMLNPDQEPFFQQLFQSSQSYQWIKRQPQKREEIMQNFLNFDMGSSALSLTTASDVSEKLKIDAIKYLRYIAYSDGVGKVIALASSSEEGPLQREALITSAFLEPTNPKLVAQIDMVIAHPTGVKTAVQILETILRSQDERFWEGRHKPNYEDLNKKLLAFVLNNGVSIRLVQREFDKYAEAFFVLASESGKASVDRIGFGSLDTFRSLGAYWSLLAEAVNSGRRDKVGALIFSADISKNPKAYAEITLGDQSEIAVTVSNTSGQTALKQQNVKRILLIPRGLESTTDLKASWMIDNKRIDGNVIRFSGVGFGASLSTTGSEQ
jgi:hypothetical protein